MEKMRTLTYFILVTTVVICFLLTKSYLTLLQPHGL